MSINDQDEEQAQRREAEIELLHAMYPSDIAWHEQRQEITYRPEAGGVLTLRIPDSYPGASEPVLISAVDRTKDDIRDKVRGKINALSLPPGDEVVDAIIQAFDEIESQTSASFRASTKADKKDKDSVEGSGQRIVVIWLHHLLNTNKRKLALNPSIDASKVSGATKPGYPGILVYSGDALAVDAHVSELRSQRWQAFQVRFEDTGEVGWRFSHGFSIKEFESVSEVTQSIVSEEHREAFLRAAGIK